jgi:hypothetical protein
MTIGDLKRVLDEEGLSDDDKIIVSSQDGAVWLDFSVHLERLDGESVGLFELEGDGVNSLDGEEEEDYDFVVSGLGDMENEDFNE